MTKQKKLTDILEKVEKNIVQHREELTKRVVGILKKVYETKDGKYIDNVADFFDVFRQSAESGVLRRRIGGLVSYLGRGEEYRAEETQTKETDSVKMSMKEAVTYWKAEDKAAGRKTINERSYAMRIDAAADDGLIEIEELSPRKRYVKKSELDKIIEKSGASVKSRKPRRVIGRRQIKKTKPFEVYSSLRHSGMSKEEIIERHPELVPEGMDPKRYLGGLEGIYQRYRAGKRNRKN